MAIVFFKKYKFRLLLLCSLFVVISSCNNTDIVALSDGEHPFYQLFSIDSSHFTIINIEDKIDNCLNPTVYTDYIESIQYIRLETSSESIVPEIPYCICSDKYFYLCSSMEDNTILIFDHYGNFVRKIRSGRGPGELQELHGVYYSTLKHELIVLSFPTELSFYSEDGVFIRKLELPFYAHAVTLLEDGYLFNIYGFISSKNRMKGYEEMLIRTDLELNEITSSSPYLSYIGSDESPFPTNDNGLNYYFSIFSGSVFLNRQGKLYPHYQFDVGKYRIPYEEVKDLDPYGVSNYLHENELCSFNGAYYETQTHAYVNCGVLPHSVSLFLDKHNLNVIGSSVFSNKVPFNFPLSTYQDSFVSLVEANDVNSFIKNVKKGAQYDKDIISQEQYSLLEEVQVDDNPVLVLYKLKCF